MAREDDMFADPAVGSGKPNRYENDLSNIPTSPQQPSGREDSDWDVSANGDPRRQPERSEPSEFGRGSSLPQGARAERFDREQRGSRDLPRQEDFDEMERADDDEDYQDGDDKPLSKFSPKVLIPKFLELDTKKKAMVGGAAVVLLIIVIVIISSITSSIGEAISKPAPVTEQTSTPQETATPKPAPSAATEWSSLLTTKVGKAGVTVDGVEMTAESIECDIEAEDKNGASVESENGTWCRLDFSATNLSSSIVTLATQRFMVVDIYGENIYYGSTAFGDVGGGNVIAKLSPQESVTGFIYFDVPAETEISEIQMATFGNAGGSPIKVTVKNQKSSDKPTETSTPTPSPTDTPEDGAADDDAAESEDSEKCGLLEYCGG